MTDEIKAQFALISMEDSRDIIVGRRGLKVGRSADNDLPLNHREISRQHMRITWDLETDKYLVEDLNSSNGVFLNGARIPSRVPQELSVGDEIRVGPFALKFVQLIYPQPVAVVQRPEMDDDGMELALVPVDGTAGHLLGIPRDRSTWLQYLPGIYQDDDFLGRYLLIFESLLSPVVWIIDNFDQYLDPDITPSAWLQWMASWFDLLLLPDLEIERQREIIRQASWLFMRRGTRAGLQRFIELYFDVTPEIDEPGNCHFVVKLPLSQSKSRFGEEVADRLIRSQKPAFASYTLEIT